MSEALRAFTTRVPEWRPRVKPIELAEATPEQLEALQVTPSNTKVSDYVLVLANDVETLKVRSPLFNAIMYGRGGLSRAERELGAVGASIVNRCIYCAAVHASRYNRLTKDETVIAKIFADGEEVELEERQAAILNFAIRLARAPSEAEPKDMRRLRDAGLSEEEILDLILSASLFGWANRLMHTLGDPIAKDGSDSGDGR
jgi:uncharacterized peroxidase-related enzyme